MPATAKAMIMTITTKMETMTAVDVRPACGVVSSTLDDTGDIVDAKADDELTELTEFNKLKRLMS